MSHPLPHAASRTVRAWTRLAPLAALVLLLTVAPAVRAGEPTTTDTGDAAGGWIARQVEADATLGIGSLADAIYALAATGVGGTAAADALARIEAGLEGFVSDGTNLRPGALAKVLLAVSIQGGDINGFGGRDLEADLRGLVIADGADAGRFAGATVVDQTLAVLALARTSGGVPASAADWLAAAGCPSGEYSWDGSCPAGPGSEDTDTTALALQALLASGETTAAGTTTAWLLAGQNPDGSFASYGTANTNSTGLAGQALRAAGAVANADLAASFVASLQLGCEAEAASRGAIAWTEADPGFLIFSTPQAVLALGAAPLHTLSAQGQSPDAPTLECASSGGSPTPSPAPTAPGGGGVGGGGASPTPATGQLPDTASREGAFSGGLVVVIAGLFVASASTTVALRRRAEG